MHPAYQLNIIASAICYELIIMFDVLKLSGTSRVEDYSHLVIMKHMNLGPNFCGVAGGTDKSN